MEIYFFRFQKPWKNLIVCVIRLSLKYAKCDYAIQKYLSLNDQIVHILYRVWFVQATHDRRILVSSKKWQFGNDKLVTQLWPFSKSKFNRKSDCVNLIAPASPIECLLYLPNVRAVKYKLGPEGLTRLGNWNVLRLPVRRLSSNELRMFKKTDEKAMQKYLNHANF